MKTKKGSIYLLIFTCMMLLAFVAVMPQKVNAEEVQTQFEVSDYDEFKEAIATIDEMVSGLGEGEASPDFVITLKADITLEESTYVKEDANHIETFIDLPPATRLTIQSPKGSRYAITAYPLTIKYGKEYREPTIRLFKNSPELLNLENITLKGNVDLVEVSADSHLKMKDVRCEIEKREDYGAPGFLNGYIVSYGPFIQCWGTAELENVDFIGDEEAPPQRGSGLISIVGTSFSMKECVFENFLTAGHSSIVSYMAHSLEQQEITLKDCDFKNITLPYGYFGIVGGGSTLGGSGYNKGKDKYITCLTVEGGSFSNCESLMPPAMLLSFTNNVRIKGVEFSGNRSVKQGNYKHGDAGGAVRLAGCDDFILEDCVFTDNYADLSGGALQIFNSVGTIRGGEFKGNTAETHGGAICMLLASKDNAIAPICELTVEDTSFVENVDKCSAETLSSNDHEAPGGGAIFLHMGCQLNLNEGTVIKGNQVLNKGNGGGVYASFGSQVEVNGASILDNVAEDGNGGGIYLDGSDHFHGDEHFNIEENDMNNGAILYFRDGIIAGNTAKNGGGVYLDGKNMVYGTVPCWGGLMQMYGGVITANHALNRGGGIYLQKGQQNTKEDYAPAARFSMINGAIYFNEAGTADKPPYNIDPDGAGAEIYNEGENTELTVRTAEEITTYIQDASSRFVPKKDRKVWFMDWYEDFNATRGAKTRYMLTKVLGRAVYTPALRDNANQALILDRSTALQVTKTEKGDAPASAKYGFELKFTNLPPEDEALPVVITGAKGKITEKEVTPEGGVFNFTLKNGESFKVSGLPAGAKFILTEKDHGRAKRLDAGFTNVEESDLNGWTVKGRTRTTWQGSSEATKLSVVELVNDYTSENKILGDYEPKKEDPEDKTIDKYDDKNNGNVKTGDNSHVMGWIAMFIVSALAAIALLIRRRCQNN